MAKSPPVPKTRYAWVIGRPDEDGEHWIAHCLDLDVSVTAENIWDALDAVQSAVAKTIRDEVKRGRDPFARRSAPGPDWDRLWAVVRKGILVTEEDLALTNAPLDVIATQLAIDSTSTGSSDIRRAPAALVPSEMWQLTA